jgi:hypothetical protein
MNFIILHWIKCVILYENFCELSVLPLVLLYQTLLIMTQLGRNMLKVDYLDTSYNRQHILGLLIILNVNKYQYKCKWDPTQILDFALYVPAFISFCEMAWWWPLWPKLVAINIIYIYIYIYILLCCTEYICNFMLSLEYISWVNPT